MYESCCSIRYIALLDESSPLIRIVLLQTVEVGAPYAYLNESFILGNILRGKGTTVTVNAYLVGKPA